MERLSKKYYLLTFIGFFISTSLKAILGDDNDPLGKSLLISLAASAAISLLAGSLYYVWDVKIGPNKRNKMLMKKPFSDLFMSGFVQRDQTAVGVLNKYTVVVNYTWPNGVSAIAVNVLFDGSHLTKERIKEFQKKYKYKGKGLVAQPFLWTADSAGWIWTYNFTPPAYDNILSVAESIVEVLRSEGLQTLKFNDEVNQKLVTEQATSFGFVG